VVEDGAVAVDGRGDVARRGVFRVVLGRLEDLTAARYSATTSLSSPAMGSLGS